MSFPPVDRDAVRPTVDEVAALLRTRTIEAGGDEVGTFNENTRPTAADVDGLIDQALDVVLGRLSAAVDPALYPAVTQQAALRTAILVEFSFFRESLTEGPFQSLLAMVNADEMLLEARMHGGPTIA